MGPFGPRVHDEPGFSEYYNYLETFEVDEQKKLELEVSKNTGALESLTKGVSHCERIIQQDKEEEEVYTSTHDAPTHTVHLCFCSDFDSLFDCPTHPCQLKSDQPEEAPSKRYLRRHACRRPCPPPTHEWKECKIQSFG